MKTLYRQTINVGLISDGIKDVEKIIQSCRANISLGNQAARIIAVADENIDPNELSRAQGLGVVRVKNYTDLFHPYFNISVIINLNEDKGFHSTLLRDCPEQIQVISYMVFKLLWREAIAVDYALEESDLAMKAILNNIQDFILVITPDREIVEANQSFLDYMGHTREQVIGQKCYEILQKKNQLCHPDYTVCPLNDVIQNRTPNRRTDLRQIDRDGKPRYLDVIVYPIWEKDGKISKFIEISRDITELKNEQEKVTDKLETIVQERTRELRNTHAKLLHQDKMTSLGKLSAAVVHEINNPIAGILNLLMLMKRISGEGEISKTDQHKFDDYLDLMETETRRISRIVSNLLSFSRQSQIELKRVNINDLLERVITMSSNLIKLAQIETQKALAPDPPLLLGAEDQLIQVLMNFVSNAVEAMEATQKKILIIKTRFSVADNSLTILVSDTGIGIPEENRLKLYEPFFTTKKKGKGVGLGLSVAYGIIQKHNGTITVQSVINKGTTFEITLPIDNPDLEKEKEINMNMLEN